MAKFHVSVDGEEVSRLKHGESATVDVAPGNYTVHVRATGLIDGSTDVEVAEGGTQLIVGSSQSIGSAAKSAIGSAGAGKSPGLGKEVAIDIWSPDDED